VRQKEVLRWLCPLAEVADTAKLTVLETLVEWR
jgi:hypothetical protein